MAKGDHIKLREGLPQWKKEKFGYERSKTPRDHVAKRLSRHGMQNSAWSNIADEFFQEHFGGLVGKNKIKSPWEIFDRLGFDRPEHFKEYIDLITDNTKRNVKVCFAAPPQHSKAQRNNTPILERSRGWITAGEIKPGDYIPDKNGGWTRVLEIFPQGIKQLYRVTFDDNTYLDVTGDHLWTVKDKWAHNPDQWKTYNTNHLIKKYQIIENYKSRKGVKRCRFQIPVCDPLKFEQKTLPIDPYLFGAWLGDGTSACGAITTMDKEIFNAFSRYYKCNRIITKGKASTYFFEGLNLDLTRTLEQSSKKRNKHIPQIYLRSSIEQRLQLLKGLMDTDGTVSSGSISYTTTNDNLARDFKILVASLGGITRTYNKKYTKSNGVEKTMHVISVRLPEQYTNQYFNLARKQSKVNSYNVRQKPRRFIKDIKTIDKDNAVCFAVDSPDHLYCAGRDLIVTHNSTSTLICLIYNLIYGNVGIAGQPIRGKRQSAYITYSKEFADIQKRTFIGFMEELGLPIKVSDDTVYLDNKDYDRNGVFFTSIDSSITGRTVNGWAIIDDPYKNAQEARSVAHQRRIHEFFYQTLSTRKFDNLSIVVMATRWHTRDLTGHLTNEKGWEYINYKAIRDDGTALWPKYHPIEELIELRNTNPAFTKMYQGMPLTEDEQPFSGEPIYHMPSWMSGPKKVAYGFDGAGTPNSGDWSVCVRIFKHPTEPEYYVDSALRDQSAYDQFFQKVRHFVDRKPGNIYWFIGGQEKTIADFLRKQYPDLPLYAMHAKLSKYERAVNSGIIDHWNGAKIYINPKPCTALKQVVYDMQIWDGVSHDGSDSVDAITTGFHMLNKKNSNYKIRGKNKDKNQNLNRHRGPNRSPIKI